MLLTIQKVTVRVKLRKLKFLYLMMFAVVDIKGPGTAFKDADGAPGWELGSRKRITVTTFKGKQFVNIREYYEKDGKVSLLALFTGLM
jgi:Transcriptional Coactivator p15 (PC4)